MKKGGPGKVVKPKVAAAPKQDEKAIQKIAENRKQMAGKG
jgi:hypothetical protein